MPKESDSVTDAMAEIKRLCGSFGQKPVKEERERGRYSQGVANWELRAGQQSRILVSRAPIYIVDAQVVSKEEAVELSLFQDFGQLDPIGQVGKITRTVLRMLP